METNKKNHVLSYEQQEEYRGRAMYYSSLHVCCSIHTVRRWRISIVRGLALLGDGAESTIQQSRQVTGTISCMSHIQSKQVMHVLFQFHLSYLLE